MYSASHNNKKAIGVFIDLYKAFDIVNFLLLLSSIESIGVRSLAFKSSMRTKTICNTEQTLPKRNGGHVVQTATRAVLGPIQFNNFINDMFSVRSRKDIIANIFPWFRTNN